MRTTKAKTISDPKDNNRIVHIIKQSREYELFLSSYIGIRQWRFCSLKQRNTTHLTHGHPPTHSPNLSKKKWKKKMKRTFGIEPKIFAYVILLPLLPPSTDSFIRHVSEPASGLMRTWAYRTRVPGTMTCRKSKWLDHQQRRIRSG